MRPCPLLFCTGAVWSIVAAACGGGHGGHAADTPVADGAREIEVVAAGVSFDPAEIRVAAGEEVAILLTSEDGQHDFTVDDLDAHVAVGPGETERGGLRAVGAGRFEFYCSVPGHRAAGMEGVLVVE